MKPTYDEWRNEVERNLVSPNAIHLTATPETLPLWHENGVHPHMVAQELNRRQRKPALCWWQTKARAL